MDKEKPTKLLFCGDDPRIPSGVGSQMRHLTQGLKDKGYEIVCLGGTAKEPDERGVSNWEGIKIYPVKGYGNQIILRNVLTVENPDAIVLFTDPRRWVWTWMMEDEIRTRMPIIYYNLWDDSPAPQYNKNYYKCCDALYQISRQTNVFINEILEDDNETILNNSKVVDNILNRYYEDKENKNG